LLSPCYVCSNAAVCPVIERGGDLSAKADGAVVCPDGELEIGGQRRMEDVCKKQERLKENADNTTADGATTLLGDDAACDDSGDEELADLEPFDAGAWATTQVSSFVRAWGVLTSWITDNTLEALHRGVRLEITPDEDRPDHAARRVLLQELLCSRLPGDLSFLGPRLYDVVLTLGVHQVLPPVTDVRLYDLLAALLVRALLRADVERGALREAPKSEEVLTRMLERAAEVLGISPERIEALDATMKKRV